MSLPVAPGARFGPYLVKTQLAVGGMASLWRALHVDEPRRPVVLKTMLPHLAQAPDCVAMFLQEAELGALFHHPNIVTVLDVGVSEGLHYIELEYLAGPNLRQLLRAAQERSRALDIPVALATIADACEGLAHVHDFPGADGHPAGLVHRDVSPENLVVGFDGVTRLVDFGVATADRAEATRAGLLKGKINYMAPEVFAGRTSGPGRDVYAAGATLYELLTGRRPFRGENDAELMFRISHENALPPSRLRPELPAAVDGLLAGALEKDPGLRPDALTFAEQLRELLLQLDGRPPRGTVRAAVEDLFGPGSRAPAEEDDLPELDAETLELLDGAGEEERHRGSGRPRGGSNGSARSGPSSAPRPPSGLTPEIPRIRPTVRRQPATDGITSDLFTQGRRRIDERAGSTDIFQMYRRTPSARSTGAVPSRVTAPAVTSPALAPSSEVHQMTEQARRHFERGWDYRRRGEFEAALSEWEAAARIHPNSRMLVTNVRLMKKKLRR